jgi:hypothetical protein
MEGGPALVCVGECEVGLLAEQAADGAGVAGSGGISELLGISQTEMLLLARARVPAHAEVSKH